MEQPKGKMEIVQQSTGIPSVNRKFSVERETLPHQLAAKLRLAITRGEMPPGTRLTETTLAAQAGVSRSTVREALRILSKDGLVTIVPMTGVHVTILTLQDVQEIAEARIALEVYAARLAASSPSSKLSGPLDELNRLTEAVKARRWADIVDADIGFHRSFMAATGNSRLLQFWSSLEGQIRLYLSYHAEEAYELTGLVDAHKVMLRAVRSRSPERAAEAFRIHIAQRTARRLELWRQVAGGERHR